MDKKHQRKNQKSNQILEKLKQIYNIFPVLQDEELRNISKIWDEILYCTHQ